MSSNAKRALATALIILIAGGGTAGLVLAQARQSGGGRSERESEEQNERPPYRSSIQVPVSQEAEENESNEGDEKGEESARAAGELAETAGLQSLARISIDEAKSAALSRVAGTIVSAAIENEDGNLVYGVSVRTAGGDQDVKVDAGNGNVLHVKKAGHH